MAVVSRIATITLTATTGTRTFTATAVTQDTAAGSAVNVTVANTTTGVTPPDTPDTLTLRMRIDNSATNIISFSNTGTFSFVFTDTGAVGGVNRCGTVRLRIEAARTAGLAAVNYTVNSDDTSGEVLPAGMTVTQRDQGWIRGTTTSTQTASIISGGAHRATFVYADNIWIRTVLAATPYQSQNLTVGLNPITATATSATATFDGQLSGTVDNRWPAAATVEATTLSIPNAALATGNSWTTTTNTPDSSTADPRITFTHILQLDNNSWSTPPTSNTTINSAGQRLSSALGFLASRATDASGAGVASLTWNLQLWDNNNLVYATGRVLTTGVTATTQGGQAGWSSAFSTWSDSLPGGGWTKRLIITTANATGLELTNTQALTLLASDPRVSIPVAAGDTDNPKKHWSPGQKLVIGSAIILNGVKTAFDAGTAKFSILRFNPATGTTNYLTNPGLTWVAGDMADLWSMASSPGDAKLALYTFTTTDTAGFNYEDLIILVQMQLNSTPYFGSVIHEVVDSKNPHDTHEFNATGLFM